MTVSRADVEWLMPDDMTRYLRRTGWRRAGDLNGRATIWELEQRRLEVIVPVSAHYRDYPQRIYEIVQTLATAEERSELEVVRSLIEVDEVPSLSEPEEVWSLTEDLSRPSDLYVDRQHFRLFPNAPSGMIPAADAAEAFQGIRELFIAAAYTEHYPDAGFVLPSSKPRAVMEFPEKALLSTGPGSFVINAQIALSHDDGTLFSTEGTFERRVLLRLRRALLSARTAAKEASDRAELTPFGDRASEGVSKTLCQALARFGGADHEQPFEVRFGWASAAPADVPDAPVRFEADQTAMLAHAAEDLGRRPKTERGEIRGMVRAMDRDHPDDQGWVVVRGTLSVQGNSRKRQVWVPLDPDDYDRALRAHGQGLEVRVAGTLTRTGRRAELRPTEYFRVL